MVLINPKPQWEQSPETDLPQPRRRKKRRSFVKSFKRGCCSLLFLIIVIGILIGVVAVAKTGIFNIPFVSDWFYKVPVPQRTVTIDQSDVGSFSKGLAVNIVDGQLSVDLTEKELTYFLIKTLASGQDPYFSKTTQVTVETDGVEIFGLLLKPVKVNFALNFLPQPDSSNQVGFELVKARLGTLDLPTQLVDFLAGSAIKQASNSLSTLINQLGKIKQINLEHGVVKLIFEKQS